MNKIENAYCLAISFEDHDLMAAYIRTSRESAEHYADVLFTIFHCDKKVVHKEFTFEEFLGKLEIEIPEFLKSAIEMNAPKELEEAVENPATNAGCHLKSKTDNCA